MVTARVTGHFGEWIQGRLGADGPVVLVTLACDACAVEVRRIAAGGFALDQRPRILDRASARAFVDSVNGRSGRFQLRSTMRPGGGMGASTAALVALARAAEGDERGLIDACITAEGASDPLILDLPDSVIWASRQGRPLADLPPLPCCEILGGHWGQPMATDPMDEDFADVSDLAQAMRQPLTLPALAEIASESATRCANRRGPAQDPTPDLARRLGALGYVRAHTGSARGLVFAPGNVPDGGRAALAEAGLQGILQFFTGSAS